MFQLNHTRGSHHYFIAVIGKVFRQVCIPYHGSIALKPRTMKGIMLQSGISKEQWFN
jgi:predicted RNA binding protein YcfA (HicA-like mRNA interferase family)